MLAALYAARVSVSSSHRGGDASRQQIRECLLCARTGQSQIE
jgi:hypothetical protein